MPNKPAGRKSLRQSKKRAVLNLARKDKFKSAIKKTVKSATYEEAVKMVREAQKALDKAAKAGTIKKNTAARKLSQLMKKVNALKK